MSAQNQLRSQRQALARPAAGSRLPRAVANATGLPSNTNSPTNTVTVTQGRVRMSATVGPLPSRMTLRSVTSPSVARTTTVLPTTTTRPRQSRVGSRVSVSSPGVGSRVSVASRGVGSRVSVASRTVSGANGGTPNSRRTTATVTTRAVIGPRVSTLRSTSRNLTTAQKIPDEINLISPTDSPTCLDTSPHDMSHAYTNELICPICLTNMMRGTKRVMATICGHVFCDACLYEAFTQRQVCPICQQPISTCDFRELFF